MGGLNYPSFQIIQDQKGILTMLKHFRWAGVVCDDMLVVLSAIQQVSGLCEPIMMDVQTDLRYVGKGWFLHQRERLNAMGGQMWIEKQWTPPLQRKGDQSLMKAFTGAPGATHTKLLKANFCRIYARCISIADLASIKGDTIPGDRMDGKWRAPSSLEWPTIPCPPTPYWAVFRWFIRRTVTTGVRSNQRLSQLSRLDVPLGKWHPVERHVEHQFYRTDTMAYNRNGANFLLYNQVQRRNVFEAHGTTNDLPIEAHPIEANFNEDELWTSHRQRCTSPNPRPASTAIRYVQRTDESNMAGGDGSVDIIGGERACSFCVIRDGRRYGNARRHKPSQYATSYRAELEGEYGILQINQELTPGDPIDAHIDNSQAVKAMSRPFYSPQQMLAPEADIILACQQLQQQSQNDTNFVWIRAHQDDHDNAESRTEEVQLNVDMDEGAKHERLEGPIFDSRPIPWQWSNAHHRWPMGDNSLRHADPGSSDARGSPQVFPREVQKGEIHCGLVQQHLLARDGHGTTTPDGHCEHTPDQISHMAGSTQADRRACLASYPSARAVDGTRRPSCTCSSALALMLGARGKRHSNCSKDTTTSTRCHRWCTFHSCA